MWRPTEPDSDTQHQWRVAGAAPRQSRARDLAQPGAGRRHRRGEGNDPGAQRKAARGRRCLSRQPSNDLIHAHGLTARAAILRRGGRDRPRGFCCIRGLARALRARRPRRECDVGMFPISLARSGANCRRRDIGRQAVESVPFVSSEPLLQLRAGQVDVDQGALARADDGGAVDLPFLQPLRDTDPLIRPAPRQILIFGRLAKGEIRV
jgi:hypothetical protein